MSLAPEEITTMNWLTDNVVGHIPAYEDLTEEAKSLVFLQGQTIYENTETEEEQREDPGTGRP